MSRELNCNILTDNNVDVMIGTIGVMNGTIIVPSMRKEKCD